MVALDITVNFTGKKWKTGSCGHHRNRFYEYKQNNLKLMSSILLALEEEEEEEKVQ